MEADKLYPEKKIMRKTITGSLGDTDKLKPEIEGIVEEKQLSYEKIQKHPILKPLSDINKSFINFELLINRALWDYNTDKQQIDEMIELNPKYSETIILNKFQSIISDIKQIIHAQDLQKENLVNAIKEMIRIVEKEYAPLNEEETFSKTQEPIKPQVIQETKKEVKIQKPEIEEEIEEDEPLEEPEVKPTKSGFYSELLERDVPVPKLNKKTEE